jgi:hypothetical protein
MRRGNPSSVRIRSLAPEFSFKWPCSSNVERCSEEAGVAGSSPAGATMSHSYAGIVQVVERGSRKAKMSLRVTLPAPNADVAQLTEHTPGMGEVESLILSVGPKINIETISNELSSIRKEAASGHRCPMYPNRSRALPHFGSTRKERIAMKKKRNKMTADPVITEKSHTLVTTPVNGKTAFTCSSCARFYARRAQAAADEPCPRTQRNLAFVRE